MSVTLLGKIVWLLSVATWCVIRFPRQLQARKVRTSVERDRHGERVLLAVTLLGMFVVPAFYAVTGRPAFANYQAAPLQIMFGGVIAVLSMWLFHRTHADLGKNWSAVLEIRESHALVTAGIYSRLRHPMYAAFWLWCLAQACLLPNWIAGCAGAAAFALQFFLRIGREEQMMLDRFGDDYRRYMARTSRIIPGIY